MCESCKSTLILSVKARIIQLLWMNESNWVFENENARFQECLFVPVCLVDDDTLDGDVYYPVISQALNDVGLKEEDLTSSDILDLLNFIAFHGDIDFYVKAGDME